MEKTCENCQSYLQNTYKFCPNCGETIADVYVPQVLHTHDIDFESLRSKLQSYIDDIAKNGYKDSDDEYYIYEFVMEAFFGKDIFNWINEHVD